MPEIPNLAAHVSHERGSYATPTVSTIRLEGALAGQVRLRLRWAPDPDALTVTLDLPPLPLADLGKLAAELQRTAADAVRETVHSRPRFPTDLWLSLYGVDWPAVARAACALWGTAPAPERPAAP